MIRLQIFTVADGFVIEVWDPSPLPPTKSEPRLGLAEPDISDADPGGWGLNIVELLSDKWGSRVEPDGGKTVYAVLSVDRHGGSRADRNGSE